MVTLLKACALFSGGKDSTYTVHWMVLHGFDICCLVSIYPEARWNSMLFHYPAIELTELQAKAMGFRLLRYKLSWREEEDLMKVMLDVRRNGCRILGAGALLSDYQRLRFTIAAEHAGIEILTPLWRKNQAEYMRDLVREGFKVMVISVQAYGLPPDIVGRILDEELVEEIIRRAKIYGFNPAFEGGEAETLVLDAPLFREELAVEGRVVKLAPHHYLYEILGARLIPKNT
jgi:diphthine-ammonia ligase